MSNTLKRDINLILKGLLINKLRSKSFEFILEPRDCFEVIACTNATTREGEVDSFVCVKNASFFQVTWEDISDSSNKDVEWKGLAAVVVPFVCYKHEFAGMCVHTLADNKPVLWMLMKCRTRLDRQDLQKPLR